MELIASDSGTVLQPFFEDEIRPPEGIHVPDLMGAIQQRYSFLFHPGNIGEQSQEASSFREGKFSIADGQTVEILKLEIFRDGIIIRAHDTNSASVVMDDVFAMMSEQFRYRMPTARRPRTYGSALVVEFSHSMERLVKWFELLKEIQGSAYNETYERDPKLYVSGVVVRSDPTVPEPTLAPVFSLERRANFPYSGNRSFSSAPLSTDRHIAMLREIETRVIAPDQN